MIVRMSKIMVMGPLELLMETLTLIHGLGIMQVDEEITVDADDESPVPFSLLPEKKSALQHQLYEKLENKIDELQSCLVPSVFIHGEDVPIIAESKLLSILPFHLAEIKKRKEVMDTLQQQIAEHEAYLVFVEAVGQLDNGGMQNDIRCIGVQLEKKEDAARLQEMLDREYKGKAAFEVVSGTDEKSVVGVVMVEADVAGDIREAMKNKNLALFYSPDDVHRLPFSKQHEIVVSRVRKKKAQLKHLQRQQEDFARRWLPAYLKTREWIESRLSLIKLTAAVVRTRMCFFIYGWVPEADFRVLDEQLREQFQDLVVVEESELVEQDFSRIPTALHNPAYFEPFELFTRLLPMPPYASFDLTPLSEFSFLSFSA